VWDVKLWKEDQQGKKGSQISESRVTLLCNLPVPDNLKHAGDALKKYADAPAAQKSTATSRL
jgi:1,4-dihydroxy-2-naphthoyl-CoA hydrolase